MIFQVNNLSKNFGEKKVLQNVSFKIESGNALGLLGRNGAGKTTTLRIIMGVFGGEGEILIDGKPINREDVNFGYLPEERGLYPKKPILEQLVYFGTLRGMKSKEAKASAIKWLERLEMLDYKNAKLDVLSKGNQQKIQLACALVTNPDFVILDEPFSGLDPVNAMLLKDVVSELIQDGKIVLFSSHQMNYVEEFCESIVILNKGKIALDGRIKEIKRSYSRDRILISSEELPLLREVINKNLDHLITHNEIVNGKLLVSLNEKSLKNDFTCKLASLGVDFDSISVYEPTLNDIFLEYTED